MRACLAESDTRATKTRSGKMACCCFGGSSGAASSGYKGKPVGNFFQKYQLLPVTLGTGSFSQVRKAILRSDESMEVAVKIIKKEHLTRKDILGAYSEVEILQSLDHPNIVKCYDFYENAHFFYIVCEFIQGGELLERIEKRKTYSEEDAKRLVQVLASALKFCYDHGVVHRDLKAENILLRSQDDDADIVLVDFGFASKQPTELLSFKLLQTQLGTPNYVAPEILRGKAYNYKCDVWSLGVLTYILLCGQPPFYGHDKAELFHKIKQGLFEFRPKFTWEKVSDSAKAFIGKLLQGDPDARYDFEQVLGDEWLKQDSQEYDLSRSLVDLSKYNKKRKLMALITANAAAKMFDDMMRESQLSLEQALSPENHVVITKKDMQSREEQKGKFQLSAELSKQLDDLLS